VVKRSVRVYIEGGATGSTADSDFRRGWKKFLNELHELARNQGFHRLDVVRGKGRSNTYNSFCAHKIKYSEDLCVLLVDSETSVLEYEKLWDVVKKREGDQWERPHWATESHIYFMVPFVEAWLLTDHDALKSFFGQKFDLTAIPTTDLENRTKIDIERALKKATSKTKKGSYRHGDSHSIIENTRPEKVKTLRHGRRLFESLGALIKTS
jgi:Domain of unknown function (DUF4276)